VWPSATRSQSEETSGRFEAPCRSASDRDHLEEDVLGDRVRLRCRSAKGRLGIGRCRLEHDGVLVRALHDPQRTPAADDDAHGKLGRRPPYLDFAVREAKPQDRLSSCVVVAGHEPATLPAEHHRGTKGSRRSSAGSTRTTERSPRMSRSRPPRTACPPLEDVWGRRGMPSGGVQLQIAPCSWAGYSS